MSSGGYDEIRAILAQVAALVEAQAKVEIEVTAVLPDTPAA